MWRMSVLGLMAMILICGLGFAALRSPSALGASATFTSVLTALLISILGVLYGRHRTFWLGFVVFGWGYALLALSPWCWYEVRPFLLTTRLLGDLARHLGLQSGGYILDGGEIAKIPAAAEIGDWNSTLEGQRFQRIGHSLAVVLHGFAGALLAVVLDARRQRTGPRSGT
jgi:MFS family permease